MKSAQTTQTHNSAQGHVRIPQDLDMLAVTVEITANGALRRARYKADAGDADYHYDLDTIYTLRVLDLIDDQVSAAWIADVTERFRRARGFSVIPAQEATQ